MVGSWREDERLGVWFSTALSTRLPAHEHVGTEVNLLMAGTVRYRTAGRDLAARAGDLLILPAFDTHELLEVSDDAALWVVEATRPLSALESNGARVLRPEYRGRGELHRLARQLWLRPPGSRAARATDALIARLLDLEHTDEPPLAPLHPAVVRARRLCECEQGGPSDMRQLARQAGISESRLAHLFADQVGLTPLQYRNYARVQTFIRSFERGGSNLLEAALAAGFGSYAQFHRVFRQVCGVSPNEHMEFLKRSPVVDARITLGDHAAVAS